MRISSSTDTTGTGGTARASGARPAGRSARLLALPAAALAAVLACAVAPSAQAAAPAAGSTARLSGCGWNNPGTEHPFYEHCDTRTNVWIQVTRMWPSGDYHRCVGPGKTVLDSNATGAWYDSNYQGGLCAHPGDTGP
ncbi:MULTISPECIES: DUF6355 family natural product biosynthesis protein [unclassified Streptomyces]|uniref:DUF6355 family natural product biosynthesis protein n=1 Tax=unclassified Streptomyces TaxID=2593676 RepID=UPI0007F9F4AB|nr:DUF6355 family natural product biosynthesis protein [Streptomyces sp. SAT1]ANO42044.1 hypothetical protein A8713_032805 [Streptomyces sp. SAT1]